MGRANINAKSRVKTTLMRQNCEDPLIDALTQVLDGWPAATHITYGFGNHGPAFDIRWTRRPDWRKILAEYVADRYNSGDILASPREGL